MTINHFPETGFSDKERRLNHYLREVENMLLSHVVSSTQRSYKKSALIRPGPNYVNVGKVILASIKSSLGSWDKCSGATDGYLFPESGEITLTSTGNH